MSKLSGNERWKTKMLLTEHQEQYEKRDNKTLKGRATAEELTLIRDSIMYPHMLTMCDKSLQEVKQTTNLFKMQFVKLVEMIMDKTSKEMHAVRRELKNRNIKVFDEETDDGIIYYKYSCRGYEDRFGIVRETLRTEISKRFADYSRQIFFGPVQGNDSARSEQSTDG